MFTIKINDREVRALERALKGMGRTLPHIMTRAIDKAAAPARTEIAGGLKKLTGMKAGRIKESVKYKKATFSNLRATISLATRRVPLIDLGARELKSKRGVTYRSTKTGGRERIPDAFYAEAGKGQHEGVFKRKGRPRLPIVELRGPSLALLYDDASDLQVRVWRNANKRLTENIAAQVQLVLNRKR